MNFKQFFAEDRAVSPVIGVILMVAITVILAAVIGTFVLGLGDQVSESAPQAQFSFQYDGDTGLNVTHDGGDAIDASTLDIAATGGIDLDISNDGSNYPGGVASPANLVDDGNFGSSTSISAGTTIYIDGSSSFSGETVRIIWSSPNSDKTATIGQFEA